MSLQALEDARSQGILSKVPYSCILLISKIWRKENLKINHPIQGRMHTPGHPGHGPGFGPNFTCFRYLIYLFHFAVAFTSGLGSIAEEGLGSIAEEE